MLEILANLIRVSCCITFLIVVICLKSSTPTMKSITLLLHPCINMTQVTADLLDMVHCRAHITSHLWTKSRTSDMPRHRCLDTGKIQLQRKIRGKTCVDVHGAVVPVGTIARVLEIILCSTIEQKHAQVKTV